MIERLYDPRHQATDLPEIASLASPHLSTRGKIGNSNDKVRPPLSSSWIGAYRYAPPDPDDPYYSFSSTEEENVSVV